MPVLFLSCVGFNTAYARQLSSTMFVDVFRQICFLTRESLLPTIMYFFEVRRKLIKNEHTPGARFELRTYTLKGSRDTSWSTVGPVTAALLAKKSRHAASADHVACEVPFSFGFRVIPFWPQSDQVLPFWVITPLNYLNNDKYYSSNTLYQYSSRYALISTVNNIIVLCNNVFFFITRRQYAAMMYKAGREPEHRIAEAPISKQNTWGGYIHKSN